MVCWKPSLICACIDSSPGPLALNLLLFLSSNTRMLGRATPHRAHARALCTFSFFFYQFVSSSFSPPPPGVVTVTHVLVCAGIAFTASAIVVNHKIGSAMHDFPSPVCNPGTRVAHMHSPPLRGRLGNCPPTTQCSMPPPARPSRVPRPCFSDTGRRYRARHYRARRRGWARTQPTKRHDSDEQFFRRRHAAPVLSAEPNVLAVFLEGLLGVALRRKPQVQPSYPPPSRAAAPRVSLCTMCCWKCLMIPDTALGGKPNTVTHCAYSASEAGGASDSAGGDGVLPVRRAPTLARSAPAPPPAAELLADIEGVHPIPTSLPNAGGALAWQSR